MKKNLTNLLFVILAILFFQACRKDNSNEKYTEIKNDVKPDLGVKVTSNVSGFITDENNKPVDRARVVAGNKETVTDEFGYFIINNTSLAKKAGLVKVIKSGYFTGFKTVLPQADDTSFVRLKLLPQNNAGTIDAAGGGTVTISNGTSITLPANAVVTASSGAAYTGTVRVSAQFIDPSNIQAAQLQTPGDGRAIDKDGYLRLLNSYSTIGVELTNNAGELLQIRTGQEATITLPVPATMVASAPATISLWYFDEVNGLWKQEGTATKNGQHYTGKVSHFSFWNGATGIPLVEFTAQIVNTGLQPLANVAIGIRANGEPFNAGYGRFGFTDANGVIHGSIPANRQLILNVLTPCETVAYSHNFTTTNSNIDLGTITGNLGQSMVSITGTVTDCNNQPVTNGYVQTYDNGFYNRIVIQNGSFSFTGMVCSNIVSSYIAVDANTQQQSSPATITLTAGTHNLGAISACGNSTLGTISYTYDGVTTNLAEPVDTLGGYYTNANWTAVIQTNYNPAGQFNFQFDGTNTTGIAHNVTEIFSGNFPGGRVIAPAPLTVTITEYGLPGGFISGHFSGTVRDFANNGIHTISCNFRIKRKS